MHKIEADQQTGIISIAVRGFWTLDDVRTFAEELQSEGAKLRGIGKRPVIFYDYTHAVIQSQEVVAALSHLARVAPAKARKVAVYTEGKLAKRQAQRVAASGNQMQVFHDRAEAMHWLSLP